MRGFGAAAWQISATELPSSKGTHLGQGAGPVRLGRDTAELPGMPLHV